MTKLWKSIAVMLTAVMLLSAATAFAASEKRVDVGKAYVTVTNVAEEKTIVGPFEESYPYYVANGSVTVKFDGDVLGREYIDYSTDGKLKNGDISGDFQAVKFDKQRYVVYSEGYIASEYSEDYNPDDIWAEVESIPENYEDFYLYAAGNYATLTKPGYYLVTMAPEAYESKYIIIEIKGNASQENKPQAAKAVPTASKVLVNGKEISYEAYNINGSNYFKLRDLAMALNGTEKNFEVGWDGASNAITLKSASAYTSVGGELNVSAKPDAKEAKPTDSKVYADGSEVQFTAYNIGGNNYFKLRDIAKTMNIGITWDANTSTIGIDTSIAYTE